MNDKDAWEDWPSDLYEAGIYKELPGLRLRITFTDRDGAITHRTIVTERYFHDAGQGTLLAFCELRGARRPFAFGRIGAAEFVDEPAPIADLPQWLDARYATTPAGRRDVYIDEHEPALLAMLVIAKADKTFRAKEKDVFRDYMNATGLSCAAVQDAVIEEVSQWATPSAIAYGKALRAIAERPADRQKLVMQCAEMIVATDKTVRDDETRALDRMRKAFRPALL